MAVTELGRVSNRISVYMLRNTAYQTDKKFTTGSVDLSCRYPRYSRVRMDVMGESILDFDFMITNEW